MDHHAVVTRKQWTEARKAFLAKEKAFTKLRDELNAERRELPWVKVEKTYVFDAPEGKRTFADLFRGKSQLIVKHFMMAPGEQEGCLGCSFEVDQIEGARQHFEHHDVAYVAVARAPLAEIDAYRRRMGWTFPFVSSFGSDFNYDFGVSFTPEEIAKGEAYYNYRMTEVGIEDLSGISVFYKNDAGEIFHTYSTYGRGGEEALTAYAYLDMTPKGRNETGPNFDLSDWVRRHDEYEAQSKAGSCCADS